LYHVAAALSIAVVFMAFLGAFAAVLPVVFALGAWITIAVLAARSAARAPNPYSLQPYNRWYWYVLGILVAALVWQPAVFAAVRSWCVEAFRVRSTAMAPSVLAGDFVFVSKLPSARGAPDRNDIVMLEGPTTPGLMVIKRVVGLPGDTLAMVDGVLQRNRVPIAEPFAQLTDSLGALPHPLEDGRAWQLAHLVGKDPTAYRPNMRNWGPIVVPRDSAFVLGDNRDESFDSRFWGAVGLDRIRGRPIAAYFSIETNPEGGSAIRWDRIGHRF
jgi:signal peptidase I